MNINEKKQYIILEKIEDFSLEQTLECGQCFHFEKIDEDEYGVCAFDKFLHCKQIEDSLLLYNVTDKEEAKFWIKYFDLERDYGQIKKELLKNDGKLKEAITQKWGVRLLNQEFSETLLSFIISQNKQIPHIKKIVSDISKKYGTYMGTVKEKEFYTFPGIGQLVNISEEDFKELKTGFRAPYLVSAINKLSSYTSNSKNRVENDLYIKSLVFADKSEEEALIELKTIKGVGDKVANCVMLFALSYRAAFPIDVWIQRIMEENYFDGKATKEEIKNLANDLYGELGGYAQQYIFFYGRDKGKK